MENINKEQFKNVKEFYLYQAADDVYYDLFICDTKKFNTMDEAVQALKISQAPVKYITFTDNGNEYKIKLTDKTNEFEVTEMPLLH